LIEKLKFNQADFSAAKFCRFIRAGIIAKQVKNKKLSANCGQLFVLLKTSKTKCA
jgi:hypothetical protein